MPVHRQQEHSSRFYAPAAAVPAAAAAEGAGAASVSGCGRSREAAAGWGLGRRHCRCHTTWAVGGSWCRRRHRCMVHLGREPGAAAAAAPWCGGWVAAGQRRVAAEEAAWVHRTAVAPARTAAGAAGAEACRLAVHSPAEGAAAAAVVVAAAAGEAAHHSGCNLAEAAAAAAAPSAAAAPAADAWAEVPVVQWGATAAMSTSRLGRGAVPQPAAEAPQRAPAAVVEGPALVAVAAAPQAAQPAQERERES